MGLHEKLIMKHKTTRRREMVEQRKVEKTATVIATVEITADDALAVIKETISPIDLVAFMNVAGSKLTQQGIDDIRSFMGVSEHVTELAPEYRFMRAVETFMAACQRFREERPVGTTSPWHGLDHLVRTVRR